MEVVLGIADNGNCTCKAAKVKLPAKFGTIVDAKVMGGTKDSNDSIFKKVMCGGIGTIVEVLENNILGKGTNGHNKIAINSGRRRQISDGVD